jgi:H+/Cl- antiporter ClcA
MAPHITVGADELIKMLFARNTTITLDNESPPFVWKLGYGPLIVYLILYFTGACVAAGLGLSGGLVIPMLVTGALTGNLWRGAPLRSGPHALADDRAPRGQALPGALWHVGRL